MSLREDDKRSQIIVASSEMKAAIAKNQEQLERGLPIAEFMPIEMPVCRALEGVWEDKVHQDAFGIGDRIGLKTFGRW